MALCVPKVMILGHSFVRCLNGDLEQRFDDRAKSNFDLKDVNVRLFGVGGRTVNKVKRFDLQYCEKVMQTKCANFVLCFPELSRESSRKSSLRTSRHFARTFAGTKNDIF